MITVLALIGLLTLVVIATLLVENEKFGWTTFSLILTLLLVQFTHLANVFSFVVQHAPETVLLILAYLIVGVCWSFVKWFSFLMLTRRKYRELRLAFKTSNELLEGEIAEMKSGEFVERLRKWAYDPSSGNIREYLSYDTDLHQLLQGRRPRALSHKRSIIAWMSFWPLSMIGTIINDPVRRAFNYLYDLCKTAYQRLSDRVFQNDVELK